MIISDNLINNTLELKKLYNLDDEDFEAAIILSQLLNEVGFNQIKNKEKILNFLAAVIEAVEKDKK